MRTIRSVAHFMKFFITLGGGHRLANEYGDGCVIFKN